MQERNSFICSLNHSRRQHRKGRIKNLPLRLNGKRPPEWHGPYPGHLYSVPSKWQWNYFFLFDWPLSKKNKFAVITGVLASPITVSAGAKKTLSLGACTRTPSGPINFGQFSTKQWGYLGLWHNQRRPGTVYYSGASWLSPRWRGWHDEEPWYTKTNTVQH